MINEEKTQEKIEEKDLHELESTKEKLTSAFTLKMHLKNV